MIGLLQGVPKVFPNGNALKTLKFFSNTEKRLFFLHLKVKLQGLTDEKKR